MRDVLFLLAAAVLVATAATAATADVPQGVPVTHTMADGTTLGGVRTPADGPVATVLLVPDTAATAMSDDVQVLAGAVAGAGGAEVLAITPTLGVSGGVSVRTGPVDCAEPQDWTHGDVIDEIAAWVEGAMPETADRPLVLLGIGRGANQVAQYAAGSASPIAGVILIDPPDWTYEAVAADYMARFGYPLDEMVAEARDLVAAGKGTELLVETGWVLCGEPTVTARAFAAEYDPDQPDRHTPGVVARIGAPVVLLEDAAGAVDALRQVLGR